MTRLAPSIDEGDGGSVTFTSIPIPRTPHRAPAVARPAALPATRTDWAATVIGRLVAADVLCALLASAAGFGARVGFESAADARAYLMGSLVVAVAWLISLSVQGSYEIRRITTGTREYQGVIRAGAALAGSVAVICYMSDVLVGRTFVAIVIPVGAVLMLGTRFLLRKAVYRRRRAGQWSSTILAVGTSESVQHLADIARRTPEAGLIVVGACVEDAVEGDEVAPGVPVVGDVANAAELAEALDVDVVAVAGSGLGPRRIRQLGWALEGTRRNMVMAPGLTEVAGPRVYVSPVDGLPLMWVDQPQFTGTRRIVKRAVDIIGAIVALTLAAPVLLVLALAVGLTSRGPIIYRSTRVGQGNRHFTVYKFRSMYRDADVRRADLLEFNELGDSLLFKMRQDPRVTRVGRLLRQFSLDELPQLINVLNGSMSLVGPRPPLPEEVERYQGEVGRRLLVKPGLTGLWQVSGRSDLSWEESVRLDLYYVENWSLGFDFAIIARTVWAVLRRRGAY
ncbi:MAG: sugar transferase [Jatrophihabitans sp.]|uniref:sugar transferase n=1 Tax=Jatrophihabitans sp. TaxID=1932789 RepID=UPI00390D2B02